MRPGARLAACLLAALLAAGAAAQEEAAAPTLTVEFGGGRPTVGDPVEARLVLEVPPGDPALQEDAAPVFPDWGASGSATWGEAEIRHVGPVERLPGEAGGLRYLQRLRLAAFRTGPIPLPPVEVRLPGGGQERVLRTGREVVLTIHSLLDRMAAEGDLRRRQAEGAAQEPAEDRPRPSRSLKALGPGAAFWWTNALLAAVCLLVGWRMPRREGLVPGRGRAPASPMTAFLALLDGLRTESSSERFYTALSLGLRNFLESSLAFPAAESTTREIESHFRQRRLPRHLERETVDLLRYCDGAKYARQADDEASRSRRRAAARRLAQRYEAWQRS